MAMAIVTMAVFALDERPFLGLTRTTFGDDFGGEETEFAVFVLVESLVTVTVSAATAGKLTG